MVDKSLHDFVLTIGFVADDCKSNIAELKTNFDIVCEQNDDYIKLKKLIFWKLHIGNAILKNEC